MPADFRLLIDSSPLMIWLSDAHNECVYFNRTWLEFTGRPLSAEIGAGWLDNVHPDDRERCRVTDRDGFDSRMEFKLEYRLLRHDGVYRWILDQCTPRNDTRGKFAGYLGSCTDVTELRDAAADAARWQGRYEAALNASGWVPYEVDRNSLQVAWSDGIEALIGYPPQWLTDSATWMNQVHPDDRENLRAEMRSLSASNFRALQYRVRHRAGHYIWIEDRPFLVPNDPTPTIIGFVSDVTERLRKDEALRRSEERFRLATDVANGIVYSHDLDTDTVECSGRLLEDLGFGPGGEVLTRAAWFERVHPEDRPAMLQLLARSRNALEPIDARYRLCTTTGRALHVFGRLKFIRDSEGVAHRLIGFIVDVSAIHYAQEALRLSEERFRLAADAVDGIVYEVDLVTGNIHRSGRMLQRLGYGETLANDRAAWIALIHPDDRQRSMEQFASAQRSASDAAETEYRLRDASGGYHHVLDRVLIIRGAAGEPERMVGCSLDITALKQAEQRIIQLNSELENRVAERTAALQAANQELEAFTYSVSHDLRAPLRHVSGFTDLLRSRLTDLDPQSKRYIDTILGATTRMSEMIDKLLGLSRVGRDQMRPVKIDLGELVAEVREELSEHLNGRSIEWQVSKLPIVHADRSLLRGALLNLMANAVKFTKGRSPAVIQISARVEGQEHAITIRDNGAGFDMKYVDKLFGVFQRLHAPGEFEGTGIGLASVRRIINRHGGRVWAQGEPDVGAQFHFTLPV